MVPLLERENDAGRELDAEENEAPPALGSRLLPLRSENDDADDGYGGHDAPGRSSESSQVEGNPSDERSHEPGAPGTPSWAQPTEASVRPAARSCGRKREQETEGTHRG